MRLLLEMDSKDHDPNGRTFVRPSARGIILRDGIYCSYGIDFFCLVCVSVPV